MRPVWYSRGAPPEEITTRSSEANQLVLSGPLQRTLENNARDARIVAEVRRELALVAPLHHLMDHAPATGRMPPRSSRYPPPRTVTIIAVPILARSRMTRLLMDFSIASSRPPGAASSSSPVSEAAPPCLETPATAPLHPHPAVRSVRRHGSAALPQGQPLRVRTAVAAPAPVDAHAGPSSHATQAPAGPPALRGRLPHPSQAPAHDQPDRRDR